MKGILERAGKVLVRSPLGYHFRKEKGILGCPENWTPQDTLFAKKRVSQGGVETKKGALAVK